MNKMISFRDLIDLEPKPKQVKYAGDMYTYNKKENRYETTYKYLTNIILVSNTIKPNIEIIEEDLCEKCGKGQKEFLSDYPNLCYQCAKEFYKVEDVVIEPIDLKGNRLYDPTIVNKINEIITHINKKEGK